MGYIPLIIILAAVVALFFMVVNNSLNSKKKAILQYQNSIIKGLSKFGNHVNAEPNVDLNTFVLIEAEYRKTKLTLGDKNVTSFETEVKSPLQSLKLTKAQYNKLIGKRPYSFVASLMGHKIL
ncbi:hypothetical protein [Aquiflexum sp.]|uniref:hypothetical protein n=1 Tax=Aquiflexum sp. TaxID=1872584 RepID=UPI003593095B